MRIRTSCTDYQPKRASARLPDFPGSTVPNQQKHEEPPPKPTLGAPLTRYNPDTQGRFLYDKPSQND